MFLKRVCSNISVVHHHRLLSGQTACIELTVQGWRIVSEQFDSTSELENDSSLPCRHFETMDQMLSDISPKYREKFANSLRCALSSLQRD